MWSLWFVGIGALALFAEWFKFVGIEYMGSKVTTELREKAFTQTIHQDIAFFDDGANSVGTPSFQPSFASQMKLLPGRGHSHVWWSVSHPSREADRFFVDT